MNITISGLILASTLMTVGCAQTIRDDNQASR